MKNDSGILGGGTIILSPDACFLFSVRMEDQYNKRIDDDIAKLVDCFADIIRVGEVGLHGKIHCDHEHMFLRHILCRIKIKTSFASQKKVTRSKANQHRLYAQRKREKVVSI